MKNDDDFDIPEGDFIPGIYRYCDRWCEMCAHTTKCEAFAADKKLQTIEHDVEKSEFWKTLELNIAKAEKTISDIAKSKNISLTDFDAPKEKKNFDLFQKGAKSNQILKAGREYEDLVDDWFDFALEEYGLSMVETDKGAMPKLDPILPGNDNLNKMFELVLRFQLQVYLKLSRMFYSKGREGNEQEEGVEGDKPDAVAKTTLELLMRSLSAWLVILEKFRDDSLILDIMILILRLKNNIIAEFPEAENLKRIGLDG